MQDIFSKRHSTRAFRQEPVDREILDRIFEAARWAPSCFNNQPWRFVVADTEESLERYGNALVDANAWAKKAPVLIVVAADPDSDYQRGDDPVSYHLFDSGLAVENLLLAAAAEGLMAHPMAGYKADAARAAAGLPESMHVICLIALGYEGASECLDKETRKKDEQPRTRKPLSEIRSYGSFET
jgi:nitroreductase